LNGKAIIALIHKYNPSLFEFSDVAHGKPHDLFQMAFILAEEHYSIPNIIDIDQMLDDRDIKQLITYILYFKYKIEKRSQYKSTLNEIQNLKINITRLYKEMNRNFEKWKDEHMKLKLLSRNNQSVNQEKEYLVSKLDIMKKMIEESNNMSKQLEQENENIKQKINEMESELVELINLIKSEENRRLDLENKGKLETIFAKNNNDKPVEEQIQNFFTLKNSLQPRFKEIQEKYVCTKTITTEEPVELTQEIMNYENKIKSFKNRERPVSISLAKKPSDENLKKKLIKLNSTKIFLKTSPGKSLKPTGSNET